MDDSWGSSQVDFEGGGARQSVATTQVLHPILWVFCGREF